MTAVAPPIATGSYLIVPYVWDRGDLSKNELILSQCATIANLFSLPLSDDERKVAVAQRLVSNPTWEVWRKSHLQKLALVGILCLTEVAPKLNAKAHFVFFDRALVGKQPLLRTWLTWCFEQLELRRISAEIPDHLEPLIRFARKLGFRYEGERLADQHALESLPKHINGKAQWLARWGSRRERMHCDETGIWHDVVLLSAWREDFMKP